MTDRMSELRVSAKDLEGARVLSVDGVLDATTYVALREAIVKAALDEPHFVVIDITWLNVREDPAWAVFTSARWQVAEWPDIPIGLVSSHEQDRNNLHRNGITRYVPAYATLEAAVAELSAEGVRRYRRRAARVDPAHQSSIRRCRELASKWLTQWSRTDFIHVISARCHRAGRGRTGRRLTANSSLRVETDGSTVSVAVQHVGMAEAAAESRRATRCPVLDLVAANSRAWGTYTSAVRQHHLGYRRARKIASDHRGAPGALFGPRAG